MKFRLIGKPKRFQRGFLLLEALLAIAVVAAGTIAIMKTYGNSITAGIISQQYLTASNLIEQKIWDAVSPKTIASGETSGRFEEPYSDYEWNISVEEIFPEITAPDTENTPPVAAVGISGEAGTTTEVQEKEPVYILYIIKVSVSWSYKNDKKSLTYETAAMRKQPEDEANMGTGYE